MRHSTTPAPLPDFNGEISDAASDSTARQRERLVDNLAHLVLAKYRHLRYVTAEREAAADIDQVLPDSNSGLE